MELTKSIQYMAEPSKFGATLNIVNSGYFRFLLISHSGEALELLFAAELKTTCLHLNMVYRDLADAGSSDPGRKKLGSDAWFCLVRTRTWKFFWR